MAHSSDEEGDYWPGYVDALTAMVKVLSFVMMLLSVAVFVLSQNVSKAAVEKIAKAAKIPVTEDIGADELTKKVVEAIETREKAAAAAAAAAPVSPPPAAPQEARIAAPDAANAPEARAASRPVNHETRVAMSKDAKSIHVEFAARSYRMDGGASNEIAAFVDDNAIAAKQTRLIVRAYATTTEGSLSESRRIAYYRGMMVRKDLIARNVAPDTIQVFVEDSVSDQPVTGVDVFTTDQPASQP